MLVTSTLVTFSVSSKRLRASMRTLRIVCVLLLVWVPSHEAHARRRAVRHPSPPLTIDAIEPRSGLIGGGTTVTIRGSGFSPNDLRVSFDDQTATSLAYVGANELRAITPPHSNGYVPVRVVNGGRSALTEFLYIPPPLESIAVGSITTVAGIGLYLAEGGTARAAPFDPTDIAVESDGGVLVLEGDRYVVRKVDPNGTSIRFAGRGIPLTPSESAANDIGDGGPATSAAAGGRGITIGPDGSAYLASLFFHRIRRIDRQTGIIATVVGSGPVTYNGAFAGDGGPATEARLDQPNQVAFDRSGSMYILDAVNYRIRRVTPDSVISTVAGNGTRGFAGDGGPATLASFDVGPNGDIGALKVDREGNLFLADVVNRRIRRVDHRTGIITTIAGGGLRDNEGAQAAETRIQGIQGIAIAPDGTIYFTDSSRIRRIASDGTVRTLFGEQTTGFSDDGARAGRLSLLGRMEIDEPRHRLLFCESGTRRVRSIDLTTGILRTIAGIGPLAFGENGPAVAAELETSGATSLPIAVTGDDGLLIGGYTRLRKLDPDGTIRTIGGGGHSADGSPPQRPAIGTPIDTVGIAVARSGDIYVAGPFEIGRITGDGMYRRIAGGAADGYGYSGDNGPASAATLDNPSSIALDAAGNLFIADTWNHCIRRIDAQSGIITTFAGKSPPHPPNVLIQNTSGGDGGRAVDAEMSFPSFLAIDAVGNVHVSDLSGVRMIDGNGIIDMVLEASRCSAGPALASDTAGRIFVHCFNGQILRVEGKNTATLVGGTSSAPGFSGDGGAAAQAQTREINGMAIDRFGNIYLTDWQNRRIRVIRGLAK